MRPGRGWPRLAGGRRSGTGYQEIIELVGHAAGGLPDDAAGRAAESVLRVLAARLPRGEERRLLQGLPAEMRPWVCIEEEAEAFDVDGFLDRVAKREDIDIETGERACWSVSAARR